MVDAVPDPSDIEDAEHDEVEVESRSTAIAPWNTAVYEMMGPFRISVGATYGLALLRSKNFFPKEPPIRDIRHYPVLFNIDYTYFLHCCEAAQKIPQEKGSKEIAWRTKTVETLERHLVEVYFRWVGQVLYDASGKRTQMRMIGGDVFRSTI